MRNDLSESNHRFWVLNKAKGKAKSKRAGWVDSAKLKPGMMVQTHEGLTLTVTDFHTYFVGNAKVWVHNCSMPCGTNSGTLQNLTERGTLLNTHTQDIAYSQRPIRVLTQDECGRYWIQSPSAKRITHSGSYDFITKPDGIILVARQNTNLDFSTHLGLSGGREVRFAGSIHFANSRGAKRGTITKWMNDSGHYQPPSNLSRNAGFLKNLFNGADGEHGK